MSGAEYLLAICPSFGVNREGDIRVCPQQCLTVTAGHAISVLAVLLRKGWAPSNFLSICPVVILL